MAICTNSTKLQFDIKTKRHPHWLQMIPLKVIAGSDSEIKRPKPAPDPFSITMERFAGVKPQSSRNVLVFEGMSIFLNEIVKYFMFRFADWSNCGR